jgi:2-dehydropantoate 2-reductase
MKKDQIKIAIVGGGNVGRFLSTMLMSNGYDVELVSRKKHSAIAIDNSYAFDIKGDFGEKSYLVPFVDSIDKLSSKKDIIIFATKSFDMLERVGGALKKLTPKGMIVTIQNIYSINKLYKLIPPECSVCMICDFCCQNIRKATYVKDSNGVNLGVYNKKAISRMKFLASVLDDCFNVHIVKDIVGFAMGRSIINGAISVIGGISGLRLGDILKSWAGRKLFQKGIEEAYKVCKSHGIDVQPYNWQLDYKLFISKGLKGYLYRRKTYKILRKNNYNIKSSALNNIENGEKTEIRCLVDTIISYAEDSDIKITCIKELDSILREIEQGKIGINKKNLATAYSNIMFNKNKKKVLRGL